MRPLLTHRGLVAVAGEQTDIVRKWQDAALYALYHLVVVASGVVCAPYRPLEYGIAAEKQAFILEIQTYAALSVARGLNHLELQP